MRQLSPLAVNKAGPLLVETYHDHRSGFIRSLSRPFFGRWNLGRSIRSNYKLLSYKVKVYEFTALALTAIAPLERIKLLLQTQKGASHIPKEHEYKGEKPSVRR